MHTSWSIIFVQTDLSDKSKIYLWVDCSCEKNPGTKYSTPHLPMYPNQSISTDPKDGREGIAYYPLALLIIQSISTV